MLLRFGFTCCLLFGRQQTGRGGEAQPETSPK
jgi:hypothetical protein